MGVDFYAIDHDEKEALHLANNTANKVLICAGIPEQDREELIGTLTVSQARQAVSVLQSEANVFYQEPFIDGHASPTTARVINIGYDDGRLRRLAHYLSQLADHAEKAGLEILYG